MHEPCLAISEQTREPAARSETQNQPTDQSLEDGRQEPAAGCGKDIYLSHSKARKRKPEKKEATKWIGKIMRDNLFLLMMTRRKTNS
jgi:hypothetical protein